jgi:hypothetical protein
MSQAMTLKNSSALSLLKTYYYGGSHKESCLFGRGHNKVRLGVALRVKNPEFYDYFDSEPDDSAQWKISASGRPIPRYFYSSVTEIVLSAGSAVSGHPKIQIRD